MLFYIVVVGLNALLTLLQIIRCVVLHIKIKKIDKELNG